MSGTLVVPFKTHLNKAIKERGIALGFSCALVHPLLCSHFTIQIRTTTKHPAKLTDFTISSTLLTIQKINSQKKKRDRIMTKYRLVLV